MGFKQPGFSTIQGTSGHTSALKEKTRTIDKIKAAGSAAWHAWKRSATDTATESTKAGIRKYKQKKAEYREEQAKKNKEQGGSIGTKYAKASTLKEKPSPAKEPISTAIAIGGKILGAESKRKRRMEEAKQKVGDSYAHIKTDL